MLDIFLGELFGTMLMILLGNGVVANVLLNKTKGFQSGWIVIVFGWGFAVSVAVYLVGYLSGAHLNPAITFAFALAQKTSWSVVPIYWLAQMLGAFLGGTLVWFVYYSHFKATEDVRLKLLCFATEPAIRSIKWNVFVEVLATAVLVLGVLGIIAAHNEVAGGLAPYLIGVLIISIGLSLGGPTGFAINPARDLGPRLAYTLLEGRKNSDWAYAWVPGLAPFLGAFIGLLLYQLLFY